MRSRAGSIGRCLRKCLGTILICTVMVVCRSCTSSDEVYAANVDIPEIPEQITIEGLTFSKKEEVISPDLIIEHGDATYHLISTEVAEVLMEGKLTYVSASVPYELEGKQSPPETTIITLYDEHAEREYKRELAYLDMKETEVLWEKNFSFPITVSGYDADQFQLGNMLISKSEELIQHADSILESMGLSEDDYHINTITWSGELYERDGEVFREALAEGEKRIRRVEVKYGGEIKTPDMIGYQHVSVYEMAKEKEEIKKDGYISDTKEYQEEINTFEQSEGWMEQIQRFLREHMTVVSIGVIFVLLGTGVIYILWISKEDTKKQKSKELT